MIADMRCDACGCDVSDSGRSTVGPSQLRCTAGTRHSKTGGCPDFPVEQLSLFGGAT